MFVFCWALHAKLDLYRGDLRTSSVTNSMAKLFSETRTACATVSVEDQDPPRPTLASLHVSAFADMLSGHQASDPKTVQTESGPSIPGQYYLHGPDPKRRPPPFYS